MSHKITLIHILTLNSVFTMISSQVATPLVQDYMSEFVSSPARVFAGLGYGFDLYIRITKGDPS